MATQAPGNDQRRDNPNSQGTGSPGSKDPSQKHQMDQAGRRENQPGGGQHRQDDKDKDRSKAGGQRPD